MKPILILILLSLQTLCMAQKILSDRVQPISGNRQIITSMVPVFKMKALQIAAMAELTKTDSIYTIAFYQQDIGIVVRKEEDTTPLMCTLLLDNGKKLTGRYSMMSQGMGMMIFSYIFSPNDFREIAHSNVSAYSVSMPGLGTGEYALEKRYKESFASVANLILNKM